MTDNKTRRRRNLLKGIAVAAGAVSAPMLAKAQTGPISMRWQSTWPAKDIFHEYALDYAKKVNDMTGGDLKIEVLPAGSVVPAFGLLEAKFPSVAPFLKAAQVEVDALLAAS